MKQFTYILLFAMTLGLGGSSSALAEDVRADVDGVEQSDAGEAAPAQNHNSSRSNRTSPAAAETNVCDGVTCADGSCAATASECTAPADEAESAADPSSDGLDDANRERCAGLDPIDCDDSDANVNPADTARTIDPDDDGDGVPDEEARCAVGAGEDCDDDDPERSPLEVEPATNPDADGDGFGDPEVAPVATPAVPVPTQATPVAATPTTSQEPVRNTDQCDGFDSDCDGTIGDDDDMEMTNANDPLNGSDWVISWGNGAPGVSVTTNSDDMDGGQATSSESDRIAVNISGDEVRAWSGEEQAAWLSEQSTSTQRSPVEMVTTRLVQAALSSSDDQSVRLVSADLQLADRATTESGDPDESVVLTYEPIVVKYSVETKLFGFIPMESEYQASLNTACQPEITRPWYSFLTSAPDTGEIDTLLDDVGKQVCGDTDHF